MFGGVTPTNTNVIDAVFMAALGNAQDFGDLVANTGQPYATASPVRGMCFPVEKLLQLNKCHMTM